MARDDTETPGQALRRLRKERGLTQNQLAALAGFSGRTEISKFENDERLPGDDTGPRLAAALDVTLTELHLEERPLALVARRLGELEVSDELILANQARIERQLVGLRETADGLVTLVQRLVDGQAQVGGHGQTIE